MTAAKAARLTRDVINDVSTPSRISIERLLRQLGEQCQMAAGVRLLARRGTGLSGRVKLKFCRRGTFVQLMCDNGRFILAAVAVWLIVNDIQPHQGTRNTSAHDCVFVFHTAAVLVVSRVSMPWCVKRCQVDLLEGR